MSVVLVFFDEVVIPILDVAWTRDASYQDDNENGQCLGINHFDTDITLETLHK